MKKTRQHHLNFFTVMAVLTCVLLGAGLPAGGATLYVCDSCSYTTIASALRAARHGDRVFVYPGDYYENITLKSGVDVIGSGADVTRIIGANYMGAPPEVVRATAVLNAEFSGFTIDLAPDPAVVPPIETSRAFRVESSSLTISRNVIRHSGSADHPSTGVSAVGSPAAIIKNNVFCPDEIGDLGLDIDISAPVVKNNIIMNYGTGIRAIVGDVPPETGYNNIFNCSINYSGVAPGFGALSLSPLFVEPVAGDFHLQHDSPCRDTGDPAEPVPEHGGARIDMGAFEYLLPAIVEGPVVEILSGDEVEIVWQTSVLADSMVSYEQEAGSPDEVSETVLTEVHDIILSGLSPSTTYRYVVKSTDADGNQVASEPAYFVTGAAEDYDSPWLEATLPAVINKPVWVDVEAFDNVGVEKIEYFVNDELKHTAFGSRFDWQFNPADFANGHYLVRVCAYDRAGLAACQELPVDVYVRPPDLSPPASTVLSPMAGTTVSGPSVDIEVTGMDEQSGIDKFVFLVDGEQLHVVQVNGSAGAEEQAVFSWNSFGATSGESHEIRVQTFNNDGLAAESTVTVNVHNITMPPQWFNYRFIKLTRGQVKREEVYYEAKLYVENISTEILYDVVVEDYHAGFQAIQSDYGYHPRVRFDPNLKSSVVTYPIGNLMPGEQKECTIYMSTVLAGLTPATFDYKIGKQTDVTYSRLVNSNYQQTTFHYQVPAIKTIEGWWGTDDIPLTTANVLAPVANRDYLVVTHPRRLYNLYDDDNVDALLSELAEFVDDKNAVLGYLDSTNPMLELLKATNHNYTKNSGSFRYFIGGWSNLLHPAWSTSGYMLLVGETEIIPSFTITLTIPEGQHEVPLCDQPYSDLNDDGYRDLALGRVIGNDATELITPIQTSLGVLYNSPGYEYNADNALLISGVGNYYTTFTGNIDNISATMNGYIPALANEKLHIRDHVILDWLNIDLEANDDAAVAELGAIGVGESIILADSSANSIKIYSREGLLLHSFFCVYDADDEMAVGDVIGGDGGRPEIVIADKSSDMVYVYQCYYQLMGGGSWSDSLAASFPMALRDRDQLAVGDLSGDSRDEIILTDYLDDDIIIRGHISGNSFTYTTLSSSFLDNHDLAAGDVAPGGKDEIILGEYWSLFSGGNKINIIDAGGTKLYTVFQQFLTGDRLAVGGFFGDGYEDILIMSAMDDRVYTMFTDANHAWPSPAVHNSPIYLGIAPYDLFAVGQFDSGVLEVLLGDTSSNWLYYYNDDLYVRVHAQFLAKAPGKDILYFNGHGSPGGWGDVLGYGDLPVDLGGVNPFVFAPSCSTGRYENDSDDGIAETFLASGAGVYIGATRMTNTGTNDEAGRMFFRDYWRPYMNIGKPFRDLGRHLWSLYPQKHGWWRWVLSYNLYGEPKYGPTPDFFAENLPASGEEADSQAPCELSLDIPMYEVTQVDGFDQVEIPGGKLLSDPGQYVAPYWSAEVVIPAGHRVRNVTATRSGFLGDSGLQLPVAPDDFMESEDGEPFVPQEYDWFPDLPFRWNVTPNDDGGQTLVLMAYPFSYQGSTTESHFYDHYYFSISTVSVSAEISAINIERSRIRPGEELHALVELNNTGADTLALHLSAMVESYGGEQYTAGLPLQTIQAPPGPSTVVLSWHSAGIAEGLYKLRAAIADAGGKSLDTASGQFSIDSQAGCFGDYDFDGDQDGLDLTEFIAIGDMNRLGEFAGNFGTLCP